MINEDIRAALKATGVRQWMVAEIMGIDESVFSRKLRRALPPEARDAVLKAIYRLEEKLNEQG